MSTSNKSKYLTVVTYSIALVCILVGLFFPLGNMSDWSTENLLFMMLPSALSTVLGTFGIDLSLDIGGTFARTFTFKADGTNLMAWAAVLLAVIAVVGIVVLVLMLIHMFVGKKRSKFLTGLGYIVEVLAVIVLTLYALMNLYSHTQDNVANPVDWSLVGIALGGTAVMLVLQSVCNKGGQGLMKVIMAILGFVGVITLLDLQALTSVVPDSVDIAGGVYVAFANGVSGLDAIYNFIVCVFDANMSVNFLELYGYGASTLVMVTSIFLFATAILALLNFLFDVAAVGTGTSKLTLIIDMARYGLEAVFAVVSVVLIYVMKADGFTPGLLMYAIVVIAFVQTCISVLRFCAKLKKKKERGDEIAEHSDDEFVAPAYATEAAASAEPASVYSDATAYADTPDYVADNVAAAAKKHETYEGPTDEFVEKLSEPEKIEFSKLFLENITESNQNVPDYVVGGDNKEFFASLFIHLGKFRPLVSDGLMNKIYNELNLLA